MTMSFSNKYHITIIGAGIIGLTTACTLLKEYSEKDNLEVLIISDNFSPNTTSDVSAGYWEPYGLNMNDERILRWAGYTYDIFLSEFFSTKAARVGLAKISSYNLQGYNDRHNTRTISKPPYANLVRHCHILDEYEIKIFDHLRPTSGFSISTVVVETQYYLRELRYFLELDPRVKFIRRKIRSFNELTYKTNVIINCTGLGARQLANDQTVRPARGQIIRIHAPWIKSAYNFETDEGDAYIIPQSNSVVLGGTFQINNWNTSAVKSDTKRILRMCAKCLPTLQDVRYGKVQVGLRPYRNEGIRLEHEQTADGINIVHCYGHSGSGVSMSWGCAKDVVDIVQNILPIDAKQERMNKLPLHEQLWQLTDTRKSVCMLSKY